MNKIYVHDRATGCGPYRVTPDEFSLGLTGYRRWAVFDSTGENVISDRWGAIRRSLVDRKRFWPAWQDIIRSGNDDLRLGFVLGNGFGVYQVEDCVNRGFRIDPSVRPIFEWLNTYTELTPSGGGLQAFFKLSSRPQEGGLAEFVMEMGPDGHLQSTGMPGRWITKRVLVPLTGHRLGKWATRSVQFLS